MLYVRQSSAYQVTHNVESKKLQYAMQDRLRQLGWREIEVIDEDLGRSAAGTQTRTGFERMVAEVCLGRVGAVAAREVSRFARNSREWQQLVEVCRVVDTVLIDQESVYAPRASNDRLLLGLKGSLNEYELDLLRQRSLEARREKAKRGELIVNAPIGIAAVIIALAKVAESRAAQAGRPDWLGFALFTVALSSLVYGLIESNQRSFTDGLVLGCLAAAAVLLAVFVIVERRSAHPMFDLRLLRLPTFSGGSVAAFGLSASIFSVLLYLVLYLQDILGYSALATGARLMVISGGILVTSTVAGRLTSRVPARLLVGPGLIIIGVSLLLMRGLDAGSTWTHLIPGMIVAGVGVGLVNPPLASTAVGVVPPQQAGMASGINSTFRQVGIATGIALLGTLFSNDVKDAVLTRTATVPGLSARGPEIAAAVQSGQIGNVIARLPAPARQVAGTITRAAFTTGLDRILLVAAIIAFVAGVVSLAAIRSRDFARAAPGGQEGPRK